MRKTKIVCTLGPAVDNEETLREMIAAGMSVARFNFSHGTHESHLATLNKLKAAREAMNFPVGTMLDTKGPEIRIGQFREGKVELTQGQTFTLTTRSVEGDASIVSQSYAGLTSDLKAGDHVLIDDGLIDLLVQKVTDTDVDRSLFLTVDASVLQTGCTFYLAEISDLHVLDVSGIHNDNIRTYRTL